MSVCSLLSKEIEGRHFEKFFLRRLTPLGYAGIFRPKSRAATMSDVERRFVDGCAIFYKAMKLRLIDDHLIEFNQIGRLKPELQGNRDIMNRIIVKDNIALAGIFEILGVRQRILIANVHTYWDPGFKDVKLVQAVHLTNELERILGDEAGTLPTLVCGDFNALPDSGVYEFLCTGQVSGHHSDFADLDYAPIARYLRHRLSLRSAYSHMGESGVTNYTPTFKGVIDYIWYTHELLKSVSLLAPPTAQCLAGFVGFPGAYFPSDHLPLVSEFKLKHRGRS